MAIGGGVAGLAITVGHCAVLSNSRGPETLTDLVAELGPKASAGTTADAAEQGDIVVVSIPLLNYREVPVQPDLLDSFGYDVVDVGPLLERWRFEPDHPAYGPTLTAAAMTSALESAVR